MPKLIPKIDTNLDFKDSLLMILRECEIKGFNMTGMDENAYREVQGMMEASRNITIEMCKIVFVIAKVYNDEGKADKIEKFLME